MATKQVRKTAPPPEAQKTPADLPHRDTDKLKAEMDDLLDEIDQVLNETDAKAMVDGYQQKGGE